VRVLIASDVLREAVTKASKTVDKEDARFIMTNLMVDVTSSQMRLLGTDLSLGAIVTVPLDVAMPGRVCVPVKKLLPIVKSMPAGNVMLALDKNNLKILAKYEELETGPTCQSQWSIACHDPSLYPDFPRFDLEQASNVELAPFIRALERVSIGMVQGNKASDRDPRLANLRGVYFDGDCAYSTDSHMSIRELCVSRLNKLLLPYDAVALLLDLLKRSESTHFRVVQDEMFVLFALDGEIYHSALRDVTFPDVEDMMIKRTNGFARTMLVNRKELIAAVDRAVVTTSEKFWLHLGYDKQKLTVKTRNHLNENFVEVLFGVEIREGSDEAFERHVNIEKLLSLLKVCRNEKVAIRTGAGQDVTDLTLRVEDDGLVATLMPLRVMQPKAA
jgi:DNA polymerase III sliding clamp (beta) subunit (PCNA family)